MDLSAQNLPNPMDQQLAPSSQLGGGTNGDHSKINGDQVITNPLSSQLRDQQQSQMAAQIVATNRAQAMVNSQVKEAQQVQQGLPKPQQPTQQPQAPVQQVITQQSGQMQQQQPQAPVQQVITQQSGQMQQQQQPQAPAQQVVNQQSGQMPQQQQPQATMQQAPVQQPVQNQAPQQVASNTIPGTIQNPTMQQQPTGQVQQVVPQQNMQQSMQQQSIGQIQQVAPQQNIQQQPMQQQQQQQMQPGPTQNLVPQVPVQNQPQSVQPVQFGQQAMPQTQPVSFQSFSAPQVVQQPVQQDPNAAQPGENEHNTLSGQQIIADTFIPITQLISSNHDPIQDLHHTVASSNVPDDLRVILNDRIKRLGLIKEGAGLSSMYILELEATSRYINACVKLPWVNKTQDTLDLAKAKEILDKHHYGLDMLKNRMLEFIASIMLNLQNNGPDYASRSPILCFVGLAGTGKTTFAKSMAEALGRKFERIPFGGMADSRSLRGQSRYFPDAEPGAFLKSLARAESKNPVLLLDEIDRVTETARADIMGVLIEALDPEQNAAFTDHYIDYPFSLQNCLFVATSNNISTIATAVLDRMEIIQMPNYNDAEKKVIGRDYVLPKVRSQMGLREDQLIIDESVWDAMIRPLGYDPGVRALDRIIGMICRRAARMIVAGETQNVRVTMNNMKPFVQDF
jgi:ATP-dependent Lon protease